MAVKKKAPARKSTNGLAKYQKFIKTKTHREATKVAKLEKELSAAKKAKASALKKARAAWTKSNK